MKNNKKGINTINHESVFDTLRQIILRSHVHINMKNNLAKKIEYILFTSHDKLPKQ
jgi:hypothetical protein